MSGFAAGEGDCVGENRSEEGRDGEVEGLGASGE